MVGLVLAKRSHMIVLGAVDFCYLMTLTFTSSVKPYRFGTVL